MRNNDWELKFNEVFQKHYDHPFEWGVSDCFMVMNDTHRALYGETLLGDLKYTNKTQAAKLLKEKGFSNLKAGLVSRFETIPSSLAGRGDFGLVKSGKSYAGGVFSAIGFLTKSETDGVVILPHSAVDIAFKV